MFKVERICTLFLLLIFCGVWGYFIVIMHPSDVEKYQKMIENKEIASSNAFSPTYQERKQIYKDIWFAQDEQIRLHYQIACKNSFLTLTPIKNKFELVENLEGIKCWMQDRLFENDKDNSLTQQARYIEAKSGIYRHSSHEFLANDVTLSLFRLAGHHLPKEPVNKKEAILQGIAHDISFYFSGKTPHFQANQFEATMVKE